MRIQATTPNFGARIQINKLKDIKNIKISDELQMRSLNIAKETASTSSAVGTSFVSGGPSADLPLASIDIATPYLSPSTIAVSNKYPASVGTMLSSPSVILDYIKVVPNKSIKNPS